jgi:hypothetical protein
MAIAFQQHYAAASSPMVTCRVTLDGAGPGDLAMVIVRRPQHVAAGPDGWNRQDATFWKVIGYLDDLEPRFTADSLGPWEFDIVIAKAGSYSLQQEAGPQ